VRPKQNSPRGHWLSVAQGVRPPPPPRQKPPVGLELLLEHEIQPGQSAAEVQGFAHVPLLSSTLPDGHAAHVPLTQLRLQHSLSFVQCFPLRLHPGRSAAASPMPSDPSAPPTKAAPINLSALPREMLPLASPVASASKERSLASGDIGYPFPKGRVPSAPPCRST
jgi:hypothetical protein